MSVSLTRGRVWMMYFTPCYTHLPYTAGITYKCELDFRPVIQVLAYGDFIFSNATTEKYIIPFSQLKKNHTNIWAAERLSLRPSSLTEAKKGERFINNAFIGSQLSQSNLEAWLCQNSPSQHLKKHWLYSEQQEFLLRTVINAACRRYPPES